MNTMAAGLGNGSITLLRAATDAVLCCGVWPGANANDGVQCRTIGSADMCQEAWKVAMTGGPLVRVNSTNAFAAKVGSTDLSWSAIAPEWNEVFWPWVVAPVIYQFILIVISVILSRLYKKVFCHCECFQRFVLKYIGCPECPNPLCPNVLIWLGTWQLVGSLTLVITFTYRTLHLTNNEWVLGLEMFLGWGFVFHYFVMQLNKGFDRSHAKFDIAYIVELLTVPQCLCGLTVGWLTMGYLRSFRAMLTYQRLEELNSMGMIDFFTRATPVQRLIFQSALRFVSIVVCFAGTILILEVLGEPPWLQERYLSTTMGEINFFVMAYWVLETISTVGYGDFAPQTTLSRFVTAACFLSGVIFFALETATIADIWRMQTFGTGAYTKRGRNHILVCGGAAEAIDANSLRAFFAELFHPSFKQMSPDAVVLVTSDEAVVAFREFVNNEVEAESRRRIAIFRGSALLAADLQRCRCGEAVLAVVLADTRGMCNSDMEEDQENILRALSIQQIYPGTPLRLELLCTESQELATSARIWPQRILTLSRMKASLLWQSCRCFGWSSLIGNLLVTTDSLERTHILSANQKTSKWRAGYVDGLAQEIYGFLPAMEYVGQSFLELVKAAYSVENAIIIAAQVRGIVHLAPFQLLQEVTEETIIFSLDATLNLDDVSNTVFRAGEWQKVFYDNRFKYKNAEETLKKVEVNAATSGMSLADGVGWLTPKAPKFDLQAMEQKAADIRKSSSSTPFILFIEFAESWLTLSNFLAARAEPWQSNKMPLIVLAPTQPPEDLWGQLSVASDAPIGLILGSGQNMEVLAKAGAHEAECIVCPAMKKLVQGNSSNNPEGGTKLDINAVMLYNILGRLQLLSKAHVIMEMHRMENVRLLPASTYLSGRRSVERAVTAWGNVSPESDDNGEEEEDQRTAERLETQVKLRMERIAAISYREVQQAMLVGGGSDLNTAASAAALRTAATRLLDEDSRPRRKSRCWHGCLRRSGYLGFKRKLHRESPFKASFGIQVCGSSKYISGEVFSPSAIFAALVARTNYVPGILEVMQALVAPEDSSHVFPWQISVREAWIGKTFSEVFHDLLEDEHGPALGLGLYRKLTQSELASEPNPPSGFVWTNPEPDTEVKRNDHVYVLASSAWGKKNQ